MMMILEKPPFDLKKEDIEQVQQEKMEYYLLGTYSIRKGLTLFGYNYQLDKIYEVKIKYSDTINVVPKEGVLTLVDFGMRECVIDSRDIFFESLNTASAIRRVEKWKEGKITELFNLRKPTKDVISFW